MISEFSPEQFLNPLQKVLNWQNIRKVEKFLPESTGVEKDHKRLRKAELYSIYGYTLWYL